MVNKSKREKFCKKTKECYKKHEKVINGSFVVVLILIAMFFSIYFRSYPATLPVTAKWAEDSIKNNIKNQISTQVNSQYPNLPNTRRSEIINEQVTKILAEQGNEIKTQAKEQAKSIKAEMQNEDGQTYLLAIDPYYYLRHTQNYLDHGYAADYKDERGYVNDHMLAPIGNIAKSDQTAYHTKLSGIIYKIVHFFNKDAKLLNVFFWIPVLISGLAVIPAFFITRKKVGNLGAFFTAIIVAVHTTFIGRTAAGFSDTDAYNITLPLFIFWMFLESIEAKELKNRIIFSAIAGVIAGIYSRFWAGWWYVFDFVIASILGYIIWLIIKEITQEKTLKKILKNKELKQTSIIGLATLFFSGLSVTIITNFKTFTTAITAPIGFTTIQNAARTNLWPNVFTTVAELNKASVNSIVSQIGGSIYFYLACLGIITTIIATKKQNWKDWTIFAMGAILYMTLITKPLLTASRYTYIAILLLPIAIGLILMLKDNKKIDVKYAIMLTVWFAGTIYAGTQGIRFILLLVPAYAVAIGLFIGTMYKLITNWTKKQFNTTPIWFKIGLVIVVLLMLIKPIQAGHNAALYEVPSMNDAWYQSLDKINQEAAPNAIITSWWDFGHWFKSIGNRAVTFDGGSQGTPMAHWVGKALSTDNEQEAIGILRMIDCGSFIGFDELTKSMDQVENSNEVKPETILKAKKILDEAILIWDKQKAKELYMQKAGISSKEADEVIKLTHCTPPEGYFITSGDMVGKAGVWGHFGAWDFTKAYAYNELKDETAEIAIPKLTKAAEIEKKQAENLYYAALSIRSEDEANAWISPWPGYITQNPKKCEIQNETLICGVNQRVGQQEGFNVMIETAVVDMRSVNNTIFNIGFYSTQTGAKGGSNTVKPSSVVIAAEKDFEKTKIAGAGINYDLVIVNINGEFYSLVTSKELSASMFTRLFYFSGVHTKHFEKFSDKTSFINGQRIIVWKINWEGKEEVTKNTETEILAKEQKTTETSPIKENEEDKESIKSLNSEKEENTTNKTIR